MVGIWSNSLCLDALDSIYVWIMIFDNTVIVIDLGNYKAEFQEPLPFKALRLADFSDGIEVDVESLATGKYYQLYEWQILEGLTIEEIIEWKK